MRACGSRDSSAAARAAAAGPAFRTAARAPAAGLQPTPGRRAGTGLPAGLLDLAYASLPASGEVVHRAFAAALTELPALLPGFGYDAIGIAPLREAIAARYTAAGVPTTADQILVTSGAQHALNIVLRTLAGRQDKVLVDHPTYPHALDAIRAAGCRPVPVALPPPQRGRRGHGWDMGHGSRHEQQRPKMAYVVPDFHNPTGRLMSDPQRRRLVQAAAAAGTVLVVDETLRELNLDGVHHDPAGGLQSRRGDHRLAEQVALGRAAHRLDPGRQTLIQRFAAARTTMDLGGPVVEQLAAAHLVRSLDEPLPARLAALRGNRAALLELIAGNLPDWQPERPDGGLSVWCRLPAPISTALTVIAPDFGVRLAAGPRFGVGGAFEHYLRRPVHAAARATGDGGAGPSLGPGQARRRTAAAAQPPHTPAVAIA